jgi:hypothetical protein
LSKTEHAVFYAWQSDSPAGTNRNAIRQALVAAAARIEHEQPELTLKLDEATRDMMGADNVPRSILEKIEAADIFVGDVTTVTPLAPGEIKARPCPNPNVTFEVGYAAAHLGWKRMILLTNLSIAKYEDLPFDFDRQRISQYRVKEANDKKGIERLTDLLVTALKAILKGNPARPAELRMMDPAQVRRERDLRAARWALSQFAVPALQDHIERLPHTVLSRDLFYYESYHGVISNSLFHINDPALDAAFRGLDAAWNEATSYGRNYTDTRSGMNVFSSPGDVLVTEEQEADWQAILVARAEMHRQLEALLAIIHTNYVEIDLLETNKKAFEEWRKSQEEVEKLLADE